MKELLWTCSSQLIFYPNTSIQVCVSQLFSRMCKRQVASQPCYLHLHLCPSLCLSNFPPSQSKIFFSHLCLFVKEKKSSSWSISTLFETSTGPFWSPLPHRDLMVLDAGFRMPLAFLLAEDWGKKGGGFQTALMFASCKICIHKQCCKCLNGSTQMAHTKDYSYLQAPVLEI